jgi:hypothetical protein
MHMTDEYAARYFHKMGWMWARLEAMKYDKTWGVLTAKSNEKELRQKIALDVATLQNWKDDTGATVMFKDRVLDTIRNGL